MRGVRIKVACGDFSKIPKERLFGMDCKLYMVKVIVENPPEVSVEEQDNAHDDGGNGDDQDVLGPDEDEKEHMETYEPTGFDSNESQHQTPQNQPSKDLKGNGSDAKTNGKQRMWTALFQGNNSEEKESQQGLQSRDNVLQLQTEVRLCRRKE